MRAERPRENYKYSVMLISLPYRYGNEDHVFGANPSVNMETVRILVPSQFPERFRLPQIHTHIWNELNVFFYFLVIQLLPDDSGDKLIF